MKKCPRCKKIKVIHTKGWFGRLDVWVCRCTNCFYEFMLRRKEEKCNTKLGPSIKARLSR